MGRVLPWARDARAVHEAGGRVVPAAQGGGHWVTLHHSSGGGVHVFIEPDGKITKGPQALLYQNVNRLERHPDVRAQHHPMGLLPVGARDHPHYTEGTATGKLPWGAPEPPIGPVAAALGQRPRRGAAQRSPQQVEDDAVAKISAGSPHSGDHLEDIATALVGARYRSGLYKSEAEAGADVAKNAVQTAHGLGLDPQETDAFAQAVQRHAAGLQVAHAQAVKDALRKVGAAQLGAATLPDYFKLKAAQLVKSGQHKTRLEAAQRLSDNAVDDAEALGLEQEEKAPYQRAAAGYLRDVKDTIASARHAGVGAPKEAYDALASATLARQMAPHLERLGFAGASGTAGLAHLLAHVAQGSLEEDKGDPEAAVLSALNRMKRAAREGDLDVTPGQKAAWAHVAQAASDVAETGNMPTAASIMQRMQQGILPPERTPPPLPPEPDEPEPEAHPAAAPARLEQPPHRETTISRGVTRGDQRVRAALLRDMRGLHPSNGAAKRQVMRDLAGRLERDHGVTEQECHDALDQLGAFGHYGGTPHDKLAARLVHMWAETSSDDHPGALSLQMIADDIFGSHAWAQQPAHVEDSVSWNRARQAASTGLLRRVGEAFLRSMYDSTQAFFKERGVTHVVAMRGTHDLSTPAQKAACQQAAGRDKNWVAHGDVDDVGMNPLSSWALKPESAALEYFGGGGEAHNPRIHYVGLIPVSHVVGSFATGVGCRGSGVAAENEVVLRAPTGGSGAQLHWVAGKSTADVVRHLRNYTGGDET